MKGKLSLQFRRSGSNKLRPIENRFARNFIGLTCHPVHKFRRNLRTITNIVSFSHLDIWPLAAAAADVWPTRRVDRSSGVMMNGGQLQAAAAAKAGTGLFWACIGLSDISTEPAETLSPSGEKLGHVNTQNTKFIIVHHISPGEIKKYYKVNRVLMGFPIYFRGPRRSRAFTESVHHFFVLALGVVVGGRRWSQQLNCHKFGKNLSLATTRRFI